MGEQALGLHREPSDEEMAEISKAEKTLLPCPFCRSGAIINYIPPHTHGLATFMPDYEGGHFIECSGCTAAIAGGSNLSEAVAAWNQRTT
jgi:hypothetical protein